MEFYLLRVDGVQGYEIIATGSTPKEAMDNAWKHYKEHFTMDFTNRKEWFEYHGIYGEESCRKVTVGDSWTE